jgi:hypothetical protein
MAVGFVTRVTGKDDRVGFFFLLLFEEEGLAIYAVWNEGIMG